MERSSGLLGLIIGLGHDLYKIINIWSIIWLHVGWQARQIVPMGSGKPMECLPGPKTAQFFLPPSALAPGPGPPYLHYPGLLRCGERLRCGMGLKCLLR